MNTLFKPVFYMTLQIDEWVKLLDSCTSKTIRKELIRLCRFLVCMRAAQELGISKVMVSDSGEALASVVLTGFAMGRGHCLLIICLLFSIYIFYKFAVS